MRGIAYIIIILIFISCNSHENKVEKLPKKVYIESYDIKKSQILYQYYEEFGFTDICTHTRSYFSVGEWKITEEWKQLPISNEDIAKINSIPNKVDSLKGNTISIVYQYKDFFSDISLDSEEFIRDTIFEKEINLLSGYYKISENTFEVFNDKNNTLYYEYHSCDY